jgi:hypothetical protein
MSVEADLSTWADPLDWFSSLEAACIASRLGLPHVADPHLAAELRQLREGNPTPSPLLADFLWKSGALSYEDSREPAAIRAYVNANSI